jgi:hypothetical protein
MWLRELVHSATLDCDYASTFASLTSKLAELKIDVASADKDSGEIVARCLTCPVNVIFWRCWCDKLVFEVKRTSTAETQVKIYAVPNVFRYRTYENEEAIELKKLVSQLFVYERFASSDKRDSRIVREQNR